MTDVVEAMARAMWEAESMRARGRPRLVGWEDATPSVQDTWRDCARAAIRACRDAGGLALTGKVAAAFTAFEQADKLRRETLGTYNARVTYVKAERDRDNWGANADHEWKVWQDAEKAMWRAASELGNALAAVRAAAVEVE